jgi:hypothetical protein
MKRLLKKTTYLLSLFVLMGLVFFTNVVAKLTKEEEGDQKGQLSSHGLFSAFETHKAYADIPDGSDGDGSSADGAGCSACGAGSGDDSGDGSDGCCCSK